jgi:hypothetical protein
MKWTDDDYLIAYWTDDYLNSIIRMVFDGRSPKPPQWDALMTEAGRRGLAVSNPPSQAPLYKRQDRELPPGLPKAPGVTDEEKEKPRITVPELDLD